jgi:hypothetical protein
VEPTSGSFDVEQADPVALEGDDGAGNVAEVYRRGNALRASLEADEVGLATESSLTSEQPREVATWSAGTLGVEQQTPVAVEDTNGSQVDPATEGTLAGRLARELEADDGTGTYAGIERTGNSLQASMEAWNAGTLLVQEDTPLNVSASTVSIQEATALDVSGATVPVEQQTPVGIEADDDDGNTLAVNAETVGHSINDADGLVTYLARALQDQSFDQLRVDLQNNNAGTLAVEPQTPVAVENTAGNQVNPARKIHFPNQQVSGHDLAAGDLTIGPALVDRGTAVVIAATSTDGNAFSVSVEWQDRSGSTYQSESAADIGLDTTTEDYARLVRKAPRIVVTVTDESGAAQNLVNVHADTER